MQHKSGGPKCCRCTPTGKRASCLTTFPYRVSDDATGDSVPRPLRFIRKQIREWQSRRCRYYKKEQRNRATPVIAPHYALGRSSPLPIPSCGVVKVAYEGGDVKDSTGPSFHERVAQVFASRNSQSGSSIR